MKKTMGTTEKVHREHTMSEAEMKRMMDGGKHKGQPEGVAKMHGETMPKKRREGN